MHCDKCNTKSVALVKVLMDVYDSEDSKTAFTKKSMWCAPCFNGSGREATRITIAALTRKVKHLEKMLGRSKS
jgi:hypothetical protein